MPIASRGATIVAGVLGGSGSHIVQIVIGIVVVAALLLFSLTRFLSRRGRGDGRPAARRGAAPTGGGGAVAGEATLRLSRTWGGNTISGVGDGGREEWNIALDGKVVGAIAPQETVEVAMAPGHHTLRTRSGAPPQPAAVLRGGRRRGGELSVPPTPALAIHTGGTHQAGPLDHAPSRVAEGLSLGEGRARVSRRAAGQPR